MGNFIMKLSSIMCDGLSNIDGPVESSFWGNIGAWFLNFFTWLFDVVMKFIYAISKFILNIVDFLQYFVQKLVGVDIWVQDGTPSIEELGQSDLIFRFIYHDALQKVFKYMLGIFAVLLVIFTIVAIVKNEYNFAVASDVTKTSNNKMDVFKRSFKAVFLVIIIPVFVVLGVLTSNAILASILNALNGGNVLTFGGQIFVASSYDANKYRVYANNGMRIPVSNTINVDGKLISTSLPVVVPCNYGGHIIGTQNNNFTGYMFSMKFKGETKDYLYLVEDEDKAENIYKYITEAEYLNGTILKPADVAYEQAFTGNEQWQKASISVDLHSESGNTSVNIAAYNTWEYNEILTRNYEFANTINAEPIDNYLFYDADNNNEYDEDSDITIDKVNKYTNKEEWALLHDGGENGLVALPQEYYGMADVIDFMIANNLELSIINLKQVDEDSINWDALKASFINKDTREFVVNYSDIGQVLYTPENKKSEEEGAIYVFAYKEPQSVTSTGSVVYQYRLLTNSGEQKINTVKEVKEEGVTKYKIEEVEINAFQSNVYNGSGNLVVARGVFESTFSELAGRPTQIYEDGTTIKFKRDVVDGGKWHWDFSLNVLSMFGGGATWRFKMSLGTSFSESEVAVSKFSATNGRLFIDYNFISDTNPNMELSTFFVPSKINPIILMFASVLVFIVLGQAVWGLIARIYDITLYFLIMPGILATTPLESTKTMYSNWQSGLIKKIFSAYGVLIGLNVFFVLLKPMKEASLLFTQAELSDAISRGSWLYGVNATFVNNLVYLLFMLVALTLIKTLPKTISDMLGYEDVYSNGGTVKGNVTNTVSEVGKHVSGAAAKENFEKYVGKIGEDGKWHAGELKNFIPGSAVYDAWKGRHKKKSDESGYEEAENTARGEAESKMNAADEAYNRAMSEESSATTTTETVEPTTRISTETSETSATSEATTSAETEKPEPAVENADTENKPEISDAALAALEAAIIAELDNRIESLKAEVEKDSDNEQLKETQKALEKTLEQVKDGSIDVSELDNSLVERFDQNQKILNTKSKFKDASEYGEGLSEGAKADLSTINMGQENLDIQRKITEELLNKFAPGKSLNNTQKAELLAEKGISFDKKLGIAYSDNQDVADEYRIADAQTHEFLTKDMQEAKDELKETINKDQNDIASNLTDKMLESGRAKHADEAETAETAEKAENAENAAGTSKVIEAARAYADSAKASAEASRIFADVAGKRLKPAEIQKKNGTQKKLDKLIAKRDKRDARQEAGKARTFIASKADRDEAYRGFNKGKDLENSIIRKDSKAVIEAAVKKHNNANSKKGESDPDNIIDKKKDSANYMKAAEEYYKKKHNVVNIDNPKAMMKEFDKHQEDLKKQAVEEHFDSIKKDAMVEVWNKNHKGQEIRDVDLDNNKSLAKKVSAEFEQDQENKRMTARNDFINDNLDKRIEKQQERVARRGNSGFAMYMAKTIVGGTLGGLSRKTTEKDKAKLNAKLEKKQEQAKEKEANIKALAERIKSSGDTLENQFFREQMQKEQKALKNLNRDIGHINSALASERQGLVHGVARKLDDGRRFVKVNSAKLRNMMLKSKEQALTEKINSSEQSRKDNGAIARSYSLDLLDPTANKIGYYTDEQDAILEEKAKALRRAKAGDSRFAYSPTKKAEIAKAEREFNRLVNEFDRENRTSYINKNQTKLARIKQTKLKNQRKQVMLAMDEAIRQGKDIKGYQEGIKNINAKLDGLDKAPPRFKKIKDAKNSAVLFGGKMATLTMKKVDDAVTKVEGKISELKNSPVGKKVVKVVSAPVVAAKFVGKGVKAVVTENPLAKKVRRVRKAKETLADGASIERTEERRRSRKESSAQINETVKKLSERQYINKITQALLKQNRADLVKEVTNSATARDAIEKAITESKIKKTEIQQQIKNAKTAEERTNAIEQRKAIERTIRSLQNAKKLETPESTEPKAVNEEESRRAAQRLATEAQRKAAKSTYRAVGKVKKSEAGSSDEHKDSSAKVDEKKVEEIVKKELKKNEEKTDGGAKKQPKVRDVQVNKSAVQNLISRVKKQEKELSKLKRGLKARKIPKGMEVPHIDDATRKDLPDNPFD